LKDNVSLSQISWKAVPVSDLQLQNNCLHSSCRFVWLCTAHQCDAGTHDDTNDKETSAGIKSSSFTKIVCNDHRSMPVCSNRTLQTHRTISRQLYVIATACTTWQWYSQWCRVSHMALSIVSNVSVAIHHNLILNCVSHTEPRCFFAYKLTPEW